MNGIDPERRTLLVGLALLAAALVLASPMSALQRLALGGGEGLASALPSPAALAGRYTRASAPGTYVDLHAPLTADEASLVEGYRDSLGQRVAGR